LTLACRLEDRLARRFTVEVMTDFIYERMYERMLEERRATDQR